MRFTKPTSNRVFMITGAAEWPAIEFETDASGAHTWSWAIAWGAFRMSGRATTPSNKWDATAAITNFGGTLTLRAEASNATATMTVAIRGTNPQPTDVLQYLAGNAGSAGFDRIVQHESRFVHFNANGEPVKSFDGGYGLCQLTRPVPTFDQVWNWKRNIDGGLRLFDQKRIAAIAFLSQSGRTYSAEQLRYESVCRWNGGSYHEWDATAAAWVRKTHILCDSKTGNIGWDMNDEKNKGKTEAELHQRDSASYSRPPGASAHWMYSGVCYADRILG